MLIIKIKNSLVWYFKTVLYISIPSWNCDCRDLKRFFCSFSLILSLESAPVVELFGSFHRRQLFRITLGFFRRFKFPYNAKWLYEAQLKVSAGGLSNSKLPKDRFEAELVAEHWESIPSSDLGVEVEATVPEIGKVFKNWRNFTMLGKCCWQVILPDAVLESKLISDLWDWESSSTGSRSGFWSEDILMNEEVLEKWRNFLETLFSTGLPFRLEIFKELKNLRQLSWSIDFGFVVTA